MRALRDEERLRLGGSRGLRAASFARARRGLRLLAAGSEEGQRQGRRKHPVADRSQRHETSFSDRAPSGLSAAATAGSNHP